MEVKVGVKEDITQLQALVQHEVLNFLVLLPFLLPFLYLFYFRVQRYKKIDIMHCFFIR